MPAGLSLINGTHNGLFDGAAQDGPILAHGRRDQIRSGCAPRPDRWSGIGTSRANTPTTKIRSGCAECSAPKAASRVSRTRECTYCRPSQLPRLEYVTNPSPDDGRDTPFCNEPCAGVPSLSTPVLRPRLPPRTPTSQPLLRADSRRHRSISRGRRTCRSTAAVGGRLQRIVRPHGHALRECRSTYLRRTPSIRDCQPSPVDLKYATTSGL